ncbi:MAG: hypothetical protein HGB05_17380 [Chloroflexi bacterium]|nr:hypothetical protein [Chloroflexota bacterium]
MTIWKRKSTVYRSSLSIDECIERLVAATDKESRFLPNVPSVSSTSTVSGMIKDREFRLRKLRFYVNRMPEVVLYGTLHEDLTGTRIETHFGMPPWEWILLIVWFTVVLYLLLARHDSAIVFIFVAGGIGVILLGQLHSRDEKKYLQKFLEKTLKANRLNEGNVREREAP